jgi:hypothetical protein
MRLIRSKNSHGISLLFVAAGGDYMKFALTKLLREAVAFILTSVFIMGLVMLASAHGVSFADSFISGLLLSWMYGGPLGLGAWIVYRLARFAITREVT